VPQAWAAGAIIRLIAILCGIHAASDRSGSRLYVDPALPDWLPELTIRNLRAGNGVAALRVRGSGVEVLSNSTGFEVVHGRPPGAESCAAEDRGRGSRTPEVEVEAGAAVEVEAGAAVEVDAEAETEAEAEIEAGAAEADPAAESAVAG
jgi:hypothetical protein